MSKLFLSYCRKDVRLARTLENALRERRLLVWRDERSIEPGQRWAGQIEGSLRASRGVVVLVSSASVKSQWLTYEYAFAVGARLPVIAVHVGDAEIPSPLARFQVIRYSTPSRVAKTIDEAIVRQLRSAGDARASAPKLLARFQEDNGELVRVSGGRTTEFGMELWMEGVPEQTRRVAFEIADIGFRDRKWDVPRGRAVRQFLTDDMGSYGDVEIAARGIGKRAGSWSIASRLYEALARSYAGAVPTAEVRAALKQIRDN